jgi:hypothetical protein
MLTKEQKITLVSKKISTIPASGGGALDLYPATLRQKMSDAMLYLIAKTAVEALEDDGAQGRT